jgi:pimeloyl-ACP methyl ester carboxylesterase
MAVSAGSGRGLHNPPMRTLVLPTGAEARIRNEAGGRAAILVNGGSAQRVPGTWSATSEWLAEQLAPRFPDLAFCEVRYRLKSWKELHSCVADARAALEAAARPAILVGFSMGGAVAIASAEDERVGAVLGLSPWIPPELALDPLVGERFDVVQGAWDRSLPGIPGVAPSHSRAGFERALAAGATGNYTLVPRGLHGVAVRSRRGSLLALPSAGRWLPPIAAVLERFLHAGETTEDERAYDRTGGG